MFNFIYKLFGGKLIGKDGLPKGEWPPCKEDIDES
jgi:hypothetical protein